MNTIKVVVLGALCLAMGVAFAQELTPEEKEAKKAAAHEKMLKATGGLIEIPGQGKIVIVNGQTKIGAEAISERVEALKKVVRVNIESTTCEKCQKGECAEGCIVKAIQLPEGAQAAVFIINNPELPMSLIATEAGWGILNVAGLNEGKEFKTEFNRVAIMTFGGCVSQFKGSPMQTVRGTNDLNKLIGDGFTFDAVQSMMKNLQNVGVTQAKRSTYKKLCQEGTAPAPENEYQKAIFEQVKAEQSEAPSNPIRINPGQKPLKK